MIILLGCCLEMVLPITLQLRLISIWQSSVCAESIVNSIAILKDLLQYIIDRLYLYYYFFFLFKLFLFLFFITLLNICLSDLLNVRVTIGIKIFMISKWWTLWPQMLSRNSKRVFAMQAADFYCSFMAVYTYTNLQIAT